MPKLAILIPTLTERRDLFQRCYDTLMAQINALNAQENVIIIYIEDNKEQTAGAKRNILYQKAISLGFEYAASMDDDDLPGENYIKHQLAVANSGMDCGSLWGQIYWNGKPGKPFHHSIQYDHAWEDDKYYFRAPNHLDCIKLDLIKDVRFQDKNFGEDGCFMEDIQKAGLLKTEYKIDEVIYHYFCGQPKYKI